MNAESDRGRLHLLDKIDQGFCIIEVLFDAENRPTDYRFLETNAAFERQTGLVDAVGKRMRALTPEHEQHWFDIYGEVALTGEPKRFEQRADALGHSYEVYAFRVDGPEQRRVGVLFNDIADRKKAEQALYASEARQAFLLTLSDALRPLADAAEIQATATHILGAHLGVDRAMYGEVYGEPGEETGIIRGQYVRPAGKGGPPSVPFPARFSFAPFGPHTMAARYRGEPLVVANVLSDPAFDDASRSVWTAADVCAAIVAPLAKAGRLVAEFGVHCAAPRDWTEAEVALVMEAAERTWAAAERARAEAGLRDSEEKYRGLFESIDEGFCVIELIYDETGEVCDALHLEANSAHARHSGVSNIVGTRMLDFIPAEEARGDLLFYDEVARTGRANRKESELPAIGRWMAVFASRIGGPGSAKVAVVFNDITERKQADAVLRDSEERQAFLLKFSDALREEAEPDAVADRAINMLCRQLTLDRCYIATYRPQDDLAEFPYQVGNDSVPPLPAMVRLSDFPEAYKHVRDKTFVLEDDFERIGLSEAEKASSKALGMRAMVASTARRGERNPLSSLVAVSARPRRWTPMEVALVEETAERTWAAIDRARAETALRDSEARFRQFSDASTNVLWIRDAVTLRMIFVSPAFEMIYGRSCDGPNDGDSLRCWAKMIVPEDRKRVLGNIRRLQAGERVEQEFRIRRASDGALRWIHNTDFPMRDSKGRTRWVAGLGSDITDAREAAERQDVLVAELQHRTRNLMGVVRSLSERTIDSAASLQDFGQRFALRLAALSRVQGRLSHLAAGERVAFDELLRSELAAHGATDELDNKVTLDGPSGVPLRSSTVQTFALALHELVTNAVKYGALSAPDGHLTVQWHVEPATDRASSRLHVEWRESGVVMSHVDAPLRGGGYGRELIERALPYQLKAKTTYELGADGVRCTIAVPIGGS